MQTFLQDLRYSLRRLRRSPGFAAVAVATLGLGIGANTAILSVFNTVLLRPLPYPEAERLTVIWGYHAQIGREVASYPDFQDWREQSRSFGRMAGISGASFNLTGGEEAERVIGARVTADFFEVMDVGAGLEPGGRRCL